jgi:selenide, water dikinase
VALTPRAFATPRAASPQRGTKRTGNFASQTQANIQRNSGAQAGDALILTKALGVGIYSAAFKRDALSLEAYQEFIGTATLLNHVGAKISKDTAVHAVTDVTGFGLLGHALEMARRSNKAVMIQSSALPFLTDAATLAQKGFVTGASSRNWLSYNNSITLPHSVQEWQRDLYCDPRLPAGCLSRALRNALQRCST